MHTLNVITGHTGGLGDAVAKELLKNKEWVWGISRTTSDCLECQQFPIDISNYRQAELILENARFKGKTGINLILCASTLGEGGGILDSDLTDWNYVLKTNLFGNLAIIKAFIPKMIEAQYGRIVFLAGGGAAYGYPLFSAYALSKVATVRAVENLHLELKNRIDDFSIIALAPGAMETKMLDTVKRAGAEVKTTVDINEPVTFINRFLSLNKATVKSLSGRFLHARDNLTDIIADDIGLLRRTQ